MLPQEITALHQRLSAALVDVRGLRCPLPVLKLGKAVRETPAQRTFLVLATDPVAALDIPAFCAGKNWACTRHSAEPLLVFEVSR